MGLIGSIAGGVTSAAGGLIAGSALSKGFEEQQKLFNERLSQVRAHRDKLYYQDPTQSAENQAAVTQARELLGEQAKNSRAVAAVTGGTDEAVALEKAAGAKQVADMMQKQAVYGASKKEDVWNDADQQINTFTKYLADSKMAQAQGKAQAIQGAASGLASAASMMPF